ncbi:MAG: alpha/beta fold hydrolase BchO [Pseudomonadota bacterium]
MELHDVDAPSDFNDIKDRWPLSDSSRFVRCGSINWHVQQLGDEADEHLLLVHGTGGSTHSMAPLAQSLADRFHVTMTDLPGHGFTRGEANRHYTLPGMARALSTLVSSLEVTPVIAVGHSAGVAILLQIALENELPLKGIVGINAALQPIEGNAIFSPLAKALFVNPFVPSAVAWQARYTNLARTLLKNTGSPLEKVDVDAYGVLLNKSSHIGGALGMMANWDLKPLRQRLPELTIPVELIVADDDKMVPARVSREASSEAEPVGLFATPSGGHLVHEIQPDIIAKRVDAMAATLKEPVTS